MSAYVPEYCAGCGQQKEFIPLGKFSIVTGEPIIILACMNRACGMNQICHGKAHEDGPWYWRSLNCKRCGQAIRRTGGGI